MSSNISNPKQSNHRASEDIYNPITWAPSQDFLKYAIWTDLIGSFIFSLVIVVYYPDEMKRIIGAVPIALVALIVWYQLRQGSTQAAFNVLALGAWTTVTAMVSFNGGIRAPIHYTYPLFILMIGWLVSARATVIATLLTSAITVGFIIAEYRGWLPTARPAPPLLHGIVQIGVYILSALLIISLIRAYKHRLLELNTINDDLTRHTHDLERVKMELYQAQAVAKVGSWVYDLASDTMRLSDETCRIFGLPKGTTGSYQAYLARTHPDDQDPLQMAWRKALQGQADFDSEHRILRGKSIVWVRQKAEMERADDGTVGRAVGITQDITDRKLAEMGLRLSEKKFSIAFTSCPLAASIATAGEGRFIEVNDNYTRDFGWARDELIGRTTLEIGIWPEPMLRQRWLEAIQAKGHLVDYETVWMHKNGSERKISISGEIVDIEGVSCILAYVTDITERKAADEQIQSLAFFDPLTGLPNRRLLMDRLEQAQTAAFRYQRMGALLFIDLDHFKILNDIHGHDKGDNLLQQVARRLTGCVPESSTVARLGGDEFVVMLEDLSENSLEAATQAEAVAEKIRAALNQSYRLSSQTYRSTPSIGVTLFGERQESLDEPLRRADLAMYQAKSAGRNTIRFFDPKMQAIVTARVTMELELREALTNGQFLLHYQPQVDRDEQIIGVEALVRWEHPQRGLVSPSQFIPLAEDTGLILPLGKWILEQACRQLVLWSSQADLAPLCVAVNVSARQFQQSDFVQQVLDALEQTGADPQRLKLELTESVLVYDFEDVITKMSALKARGVGFSLDDFGTGYSSLSYLKQLPLDQLKIDQTFVGDILDDANNAAIARMVIVLAESLGLAVIAEGVETVAQRDALQRQGCHAYQGYLFSRPLPAAALEEFMKRSG